MFAGPISSVSFSWFEKANLNLLVIILYFSICASKINSTSFTRELIKFVRFHQDKILKSGHDKFSL